MFGRMLFLVFLAVPLIEIALFILIGQAIGVVPTLLGVLLTAIAGALLIRWQGMAALRDMQAAMRRGELPARQMGDTMLIGLGGLLLLLPGYFSDVIGILLLLPWTRELLYRFLASHFRVVAANAGPADQRDPTLVELGDGDWRDRSSL